MLCFVGVEVSKEYTKVYTKLLLFTIVLRYQA